MITNADMARRLTQVADALASYAHLPLIELANVGMNGTIHLSAAYTELTTRVRIVAAWAHAFGSPVVLDAPRNEVRTHVPLVDDLQALVYANIGHQMVYALRAQLGLSLELDAVGPTEVPAQRLLDALTAPPVPPATAGVVPAEPAPAAPAPGDVVPAADTALVDAAPAVADA